MKHKSMFKTTKRDIIYILITTHSDVFFVIFFKVHFLFYMHFLFHTHTQPSVRSQKNIVHQSNREDENV